MATDEFEVGDPLPVDVDTVYERGIAIDRRGFFVRAYEWPKGTQRPKLNPKGTPEDRKLSWLTIDEALADPQPNGKWDADNLVWLLPETPAYEVLQRPDRPEFWTMQSTRFVWPERLPDLPAGRKWVFADPPQTRARRPVWSDVAEAWLLPSRRMVVDGEGICRGVQLVLDEADVVVPPGGRVVADPDTITVTDELGEERGLTIGDVLAPDDTVAEPKPPRYKRVPVRILYKALQRANKLAAFRTFLEGKGYTSEDFEGIRTVSLNNALLREFVRAEGFTLRQAYNALQKVAEDELEAEERLEAELREER